MLKLGNLTVETFTPYTVLLQKFNTMESRSVSRSVESDPEVKLLVVDRCFLILPMGGIGKNWET